MLFRVDYPALSYHLPRLIVNHTQVTQPRMRAVSMRVKSQRLAPLRKARSAFERSGTLEVLPAELSSNPNVAIGGAEVPTPAATCTTRGRAEPYDSNMSWGEGDRTT